MRNRRNDCPLLIGDFRLRRLARTGNTNADYFQIKLTPGDYFLVFDYGPSTRANTDHYVDGDALGRNCRLTRTKITLYYTLPAK